jgi:hypothetical protein
MAMPCTNSHSTGNVTGNSYTGGLIGNSNSRISDSNASGNVAVINQDSNSIGGLLGRNNYGGTRDQCFCLGQRDGWLGLWVA